MSYSDSRMPPLRSDLYLISTISWIFYSPYCLESLFYFYYCRIPCYYLNCIRQQRNDRKGNERGFE